MNNNKYIIEFVYKNGDSNESFVGVGRPLSTTDEYLIKSPDDTEFVVLKSSVKSFSVMPYTVE